MSKILNEMVSKFGDRVRFNWGYHDAALTVSEGWDNPEDNYGFGPALAGLTCPEDVLSRHDDAPYALGWTHGYADAKAGADTSSSEPAWLRAMTK